ncbi:hypothetical protein BS78_05G219600 [Paspalum vaginatum]|nr:hypothetical protein BS78_05G219600 [Paspalum vaginatum]KAJ1276511.1 hypothetical protein BS78_05G219600 [Paspalum vaginatum]KAJ1276515.1 hypothetical protein BS78_05G219600 [Paspalum vaginatum]
MPSRPRASARPRHSAPTRPTLGPPTRPPRCHHRAPCTPVHAQSAAPQTRGHRAPAFLAAHPALGLAPAPPRIPPPTRTRFPRLAAMEEDSKVRRGGGHRPSAEPNSSPYPPVASAAPAEAGDDGAAAAVPEAARRPTSPASCRSRRGKAIAGGAGTLSEARPSRRHRAGQSRPACCPNLAPHRRRECYNSRSTQGAA